MGQNTRNWLIVCTQRYGYRNERQTDRGTQAGESCATPLLLRRAWRKLLEHFIHALIEVLDVLVGVVGERVARAASPDQLLGLGIEEIDNYGAHLVRIGRGRCLTKTSATKAPKTPASSKPVVKRIQGLLILGDLHGHVHLHNSSFFGLLRFR